MVKDAGKLKINVFTEKIESHGNFSIVKFVTPTPNSFYGELYKRFISSNLLTSSHLGRGEGPQN